MFDLSAHVPSYRIIPPTSSSTLDLVASRNFPAVVNLLPVLIVWIAFGDRKGIDHA